MEKLIILDYATATAHMYDVDNDADIDERYIRNLGFKPSCCSWMFGENIEITVHKAPLK